MVDARRPASQSVAGGEAGCAYGPFRWITRHAMITIRDVERFIPIVKPLFNGIRSVRDLWDFFRALRGAGNESERNREEAPKGSDARDNPHDPP